MIFKLLKLVDYTEESFHYILVDLTVNRKRDKILNKKDFIDFVKSGKEYMLIKVLRTNLFTNHVQLELIKWLSDYSYFKVSGNIMSCLDNTGSKIIVEYTDFSEGLAELIVKLWDKLGQYDRLQIAKIIKET